MPSMTVRTILASQDRIAAHQERLREAAIRRVRAGRGYLRDAALLTGLSEATVRSVVARWHADATGAPESPTASLDARLASVASRGIKARLHRIRSPVVSCHRHRVDQNILDRLLALDDHPLAETMKRPRTYLSVNAIAGAMKLNRRIIANVLRHLIATGVVSARSATHHQLQFEVADYRRIEKAVREYLRQHPRGTP